VEIKAAGIAGTRASRSGIDIAGFDMSLRRKVRAGACVVLWSDIQNRAQARSQNSPCNVMDEIRNTWANRRQMVFVQLSNHDLMLGHCQATDRESPAPREQTQISDNQTIAIAASS
jgi:hypothetical protein